MELKRADGDGDAQGNLPRKGQSDEDDDEIVDNGRGEGECIWN
jgi:hypothetical protein